MNLAISLIFDGFDFDHSSRISLMLFLFRGWRFNERNLNLKHSHATSNPHLREGLTTNFDAQIKVSWESWMYRETVRHFPSCLSMNTNFLSALQGLGKLNVVRCRRRRQRWMDALAGGAAAGNGGVPDSLGGRGRTWVGPPARHRESMGKAVAAGARFCAVLR